MRDVTQQPVATSVAQVSSAAGEAWRSLWPGYPPVEQRAEEQDAALDPCDLPFTSLEAGAIRRELQALLERRTRRAAASAEVDDFFEEVRNAAADFTTTRQFETAPVRPELDVRRILRRLRTHPGGLTRVLAAGELNDLLALGVERVLGVPRPPCGWKRRLQREPGLLRAVVDNLLALPLLQKDDGRARDDALIDYVAALSRIYSAASGRRPRRSVSSDPRNPGKPGGPAIRFMRACIAPFAPGISDEAIAARIRQIASQARSRR